MKAQNESKVGEKNIKYYNCFKFGHYSLNCPKPQKKESCNICQRTTHQTANCTRKVSNFVELRTEASVNPIKDNYIVTATVLITKSIKINNVKTQFVIDSGSTRSSIRKTFADTVGQTSNCSIVLNRFAGGQ